MPLPGVLAVVKTLEGLVLCPWFPAVVAQPWDHTPRLCVPEKVVLDSGGFWQY